DASLCLLALAARGREVVVLRDLLEHRLERAQFYGARFGTLLLEALCEMHQSTHGALDEASMLLGAAGRVMVARDGASTGAGGGQLSPSAAKAIGDADLTAIAPGHFEEEIPPVLDRAGQTWSKPLAWCRGCARNGSRFRETWPATTPLCWGSI